MASVTTVHKKLKKKHVPKIEAGVYAETTAQTLTLVAIYVLQKHGVSAVPEEIISACFRLFPQSFSLKHYPRWPDSALVLRRLADCREKGLLKGNAVEGFELKFKAHRLAERTALNLGVTKPARKKTPVRIKVKPALQTPKPAAQKAPRKIAPAATIKRAAVKSALQKEPAKVVAPQVVKRPIKPQTVVEKKPEPQIVVKTAPVKAKRKASSVEPAQMALPLPVKREAKPVKSQTLPPKIIAPHVSKEERAKAEKIVRALERADAYKQFRQHGARAKIADFDFRNMLFATMESTPETLARNLALFKHSAALHERNDLSAFLDFCETHFAKLLKPTSKKPAKLR
ncbi:MAG: hypothetical protein IT310_01130 [Anaerolineales bacterium]|nr:hypothetical protein [Anaerolineales bacterium]